MFGLLMIDEYFLVVEISFAIVTPRPAENLFNIRVAALLFAHPAASICR